MFPHGIIYEAGRSQNSGEFKLMPSLAKRVSFHLLRGFGAGLVAFAIVGIIFSFWPIVSQEFLYRFGSKEQAEVNKFAQIIGKSRANELGLDPYFSLYIPKIDAKAKVIPNVDPGKPANYLKALSEGVAHA